MSEPATYALFLGTWILDPRSCNYEQGDPPQAGTYSIREDGKRLVFDIDWVDAEGERHKVSFSGHPTGDKEAFAGGDLADAMAIDPASERELTSYAYYQGRELMVAQRQIDASGQAMRVTQIVRFADGGHLANVAIYIKRQDN